MLAFQRISCLSVVKLPDWHIPVDQIKVPSIVVAMTLDASPLCFILSDQGGVQSSLRRQAFTNIAVAAETLELGRPYAGIMAIRAMTGTVQETVGIGKLARRDLGGAAFDASDQKQQPCQAYIYRQAADPPVALSGTAHMFRRK